MRLSYGVGEVGFRPVVDLDFFDSRDSLPIV